MMANKILEHMYVIENGITRYYTYFLCGGGRAGTIPLLYNPIGECMDGHLSIGTRFSIGIGIGSLPAAGGIAECYIYMV